MKPKNELISIIIPAYQAESTIAQTLSYLDEQDYQGEVETIVVNSSQDRTQQNIQKQFPHVKVIQLPQRAYTGEAKNIGLRHAQGQILAFIDSDCVPRKNWLSVIKKMHSKGHWIVGGSIGNLNPANIISKAEYLMELVQLSPGSRTRFVSLISTANCFFDQRIFDTHGLFPSIRKGVDMLFSYVLMKKGEKILFSPDMRIDHACSTSLKRFWKKQVYHGEYSIIARKQAGMPGSFLSRTPVFIPVLPWIRGFFILKHILLLDRKLIKDLVLSFPVFAAGILAWSLGCGKSMVK
ncbi:MAG: glycosyltransferase [Candidatus Aminicenantes bacterium]|nr:glycosyltransferase [Candidatus Aminicenantes bacterium]